MKHKQLEVNYHRVTFTRYEDHSFGGFEHEIDDPLEFIWWQIIRVIKYIPDIYK